MESSLKRIQNDVLETNSRTKKETHFHISTVGKKLLCINPNKGRGWFWPPPLPVLDPPFLAPKRWRALLWGLLISNLFTSSDDVRFEISLLAFEKFDIKDN